MAKTTRSGLGRGLNSLLGASYEEAMPEETSAKPARERVTVDPGEIPTYDPILEPRSHASSVHAASQVKASVQQTGRREAEKAAPQPALEEKVEEPVVSKPRRYDEVPIEFVKPNPDQPRTNFKKDELEELAASIEKDGLLQPILVRTMGKDSYQIIAGERRWQACNLIGLKTVPVRIKDVDDGKALELALVENIQRSDLNPIEEAYGYRRMMERNNMTQSDVAQAMAKGRSTVANALRLLDLPEEAQRLLYEEKITAGHARAILSIPTKEGREKLTEKMVAEKITVREAETIARLLSGKPGDGEATPRQPLPATYKTVAKALRDVLRTNVRVKSSKGKNKIEIEFKDEEDLERLFEELIASVS